MGRIVRFPITVLTTKANEAVYGICPQLESTVRDLSTATSADVASEYAIREALTAIAIAPTSAYNVTNAGSPIFVSLCGTYPSDLSATFNSLCGLNLFWVTSDDDTVYLHTKQSDSTNTCAYVEQPTLNGGMYQKTGTITESSFSLLSANMYYASVFDDMEDGDIIGKVVIKCLSGYSQDAAQMSLGTTTHPNAIVDWFTPPVNPSSTSKQLVGFDYGTWMNNKVQFAETSYVEDSTANLKTSQTIYMFCNGTLDSAGSLKYNLFYDRLGDVPVTVTFFVFGGENASSNPTDTTYEYLDFSDAWMIKATTLRTMESHTAFGKTGYGWVTGAGTSCPATDRGKIDKYTKGTDSWTEEIDDATLKTTGGYGKCASLIADPYAYLFGGYSDNYSVFKYNVDTKTLSLIATSNGDAKAVLDPRMHASAAGIGTSIYIVGGTKSMKSAERYNTSIETSYALHTFAEQKYHGGAGVISNEAYFIAGSNSGNFTTPYDAFYKYSPASDTWTLLSLITSGSTRIEYANDTPACGAVGGKFYRAGGYRSGSGVIAETAKYTPTLGTWSYVSDLPAVKRKTAGSVI